MKSIISIIMCLILIIIFSFSATSNSEWSTSTIISSESTANAYRACVAEDTCNTLHIAWKDQSDILNAGSDWDIFYKYKPTYGNWTTTEIVTTASINDSTCLSLAVDSENTVHIAWKEDQSDILNAGSDWDIFYKYKPWNGSWTQPILISTADTSVCSCPAIDVDSQGTIHLAWADNIPLQDADTDTDVFYTCKPKHGNWTPIEIASKTSTANTHDPFLAVDNNGSVHIVWYEQRQTNGNWDIFYAYKPNNGKWNESEIISSDCSGSSVDPCIAIDSNNNVHVIWNDNTDLTGSGGDYDIFHRVKTYQKQWGEIEIISRESNCNCNWPSMFIDSSDTVYVAWADQTQYGNNDSDYDIVLSYKTKTSSWHPVEFVSEKSVYDSNWPCFTVDDQGTIHMTWWDRTPSKWITYYSMGTISDTIEEKNTTALSMGLLLILLASMLLIRKYYKSTK